MADPSPRAHFDRLLSDTRLEVDAALARLFERADARRRAQVPSPEEPLAGMGRALRDLTLRGGKRLRAALVRVGFEGAGGAPLSAAFALGASYELLQSYFLVQDDWMDGDETRRGAPSVHVALTGEGPPARGAALAILASDLGWGLSLEAVLEAGLAPARAVDALRALLEVHEQVVWGQAIDVAQAAVDVEAMHVLKTSSYTVEGPLDLGARAAGADADTLRALRRYSRPVGVAFQLRDDLLGTFGDEAATGKPVGNDLRAGKRTAVLDAARRLVPAPAYAAWERTVVGVATASEADVRRVIRALEEAGARAEVEQRLDALLATGRSAAASLPLAASARTALEGLVDLLGSTRS